MVEVTEVFGDLVDPGLGWPHLMYVWGQMVIACCGQDFLPGVSWLIVSWPQRLALRTAEQLWACHTSTWTTLPPEVRRTKTTIQTVSFCGPYAKPLLSKDHIPHQAWSHISHKSGKKQAWCIQSMNLLKKSPAMGLGTTAFLRRLFTFQKLMLWLHKKRNDNLVTFCHKYRVKRSHLLY